MRRTLRLFARLTLALALVLATAWGALALYYRLPAPEFARVLAAALFALGGLTSVIAVFSRRRRQALGLFAATFTALLIWWSAITPSATGDFAPDVARQTTGTVEGDRLTLVNVRNFEWRSETDVTPRWDTRSYDLTQLRTLDLFLSYWGGPEMAHVIMSFGFAGGEQLAWSIEVRRSVGGGFSPIADIFKSNPLLIVAADERDVLGVRTFMRGEDVQLYRLNAPQSGMRALLLEYVADANALAAKPAFYNSLVSNCATTVVLMIRAVGDPLPLDWRLVVNGYLPDYAYAQGGLDMRVPLADLRRMSHIAARARAAEQGKDFSRAIREGVPAPVPR